MALSTKKDENESLLNEDSNSAGISYYDASFGGQLPLVLMSPVSIVIIMFMLAEKFGPEIVALIGVPVVFIVIVVVLKAVKKRIAFFEDHPDDGMTLKNAKKVILKK